MLLGFTEEQRVESRALGQHLAQANVGGGGEGSPSVAHREVLGLMAVGLEVAVTEGTERPVGDYTETV